tara:strand:+ start:1944 stop:3737 length:1794 start_codon:yes stop_codon:yes gene_type:complete
MAQTIQIKRSSSTNTPTSLSAGELAYSDSSDKLFVGQPSNNTVVSIGGKYYTDVIDARTLNTVNANATTNTANRTYKIQRDSNNHSVVNVPWAGGSLSDTLTIGDIVTSSQKIQFNASNSNNLQISHDASTGLIREIGSGTLKIQGQDIEIVGDDSKSGISVTKDGSNAYSTTSIDVDTTEVFSASLAGVKLENGTRIDEFSTDGTLAGNSDLAVPTEKAVKTYVGTQTATAAVVDGGTSLATGDQIHTFVNDQGFVTSSGVTSVGATAPVTSSGGTTPTIGVTTGTVANGGTSLATGDQIYDFVTGGWTSTSSATYHLPFGSKITMGDTDSNSGSKNFEISTTGGSSGSRNVLLQENGGGSITIQGESLFLMHSDSNDAIELTTSGSDTVTVFRSNGSEVARVKAGEFAIQSSAKLTGALEFSTLTDAGESIAIAKFVDEADGIANNDNDTSIPTSAAVKDFVTDQNYLTSETFAASDAGNFTFSGDTISTSGSTVTINDALTVTGDLVVQGTTTTVSSNTVELGDAILLLNSDQASTNAASTDDAGLEVKRGTSNSELNAFLVWDESADRWSVDPGTGTLSPLNVENVAIDGGTF